MVKVNNLQTCLQLAGNHHKYQIILIALLSILFFLVNFILIGPSYIFMNPTFKCDGSGEQIIKEENACQIINSCRIIQSFTLTAKLKLYCQNQLDRVLFQTLFSVGSLIGLLFMNTLADTKGRRYSTLLSLAIALTGILTNTFGGILQSSLLIIISQILLGFGGYSLFVLSFIILGDFCEDSFRQKGIVLLNAAAGISLIFMGIFYLFQFNWIIFLLVCLCLPMGILTIIFALILQQSPYILMVHGRKQECLKMYERVCKLNGNQARIAQIKMLLFRKQSIPIRDERPYIVKIIQIIKKWQNLRIIILIGLIYAIGNIMYFGIQFTFEDQGFNYGINSIIIGSVQMISFYFLHFNMQRMSRTKGISVFFGITAFVGILFAVPFIQHSNYLSSGLIGISRIFFTIGYTLIVCLQTESFSVQIQSTAAGIIEAISLLGIIVAPGIVSVSMSMDFNPMVVLSLLLIFGIIPNKFIKETHPDAVQKSGNPLFIEQNKDTHLGQQLISIHTDQ